MAVPFTLKLDPLTHDLSFDSNGTLELVSGPALVAQKLRVRLNWMLGEWPLDITRGIDYLGSILVKGPSLEIIRAIFVDAITETPGVQQLLSLSLDLDGRTLTIDFKVLVGDVVLTVAGETQDFTSIFLTLSIVETSILGGLGTIL